MGHALNPDDIGPHVPVRLSDACSMFLGGSFNTAWLRRQIEIGNCESYSIAGRTLVSRSQVEALCERIQINPQGHLRRVAIEADVYFVRCNEFVKIGYATNVDHRFRTMQTSSPYELELLATMIGGVDLEARLHRRFSHLRHRGEWFRLTDEISSFLAGDRATDD